MFPGALCAEGDLAVTAVPAIGRAPRRPQDNRTDHLARRFYRPELDVVRLFAFLLVFVHHVLVTLPAAGVMAIRPAGAAGCVGWATGFGLSLFFTLSAFLIAELLLREREATGAVQVRRFYLRRALRIWPLYFAGLAVGLFVLLCRHAHPGEIAWTAWAALMLGNWAAIFGTIGPNPMGVLWSISVEEQFYAFIPWLIRGLGVRLLALFCIGLLALGDVLLFVLGKMPVSDRALWYNSFVQFECFAAGILLCLALRGGTPRLAAGWRVALVAVAGGCWYAAQAVFHIRFGGTAPAGSLNLICGYSLTAIGSCLVLYSFLGLDRSVLPRWAIYGGRISFGLYVFHMLALQLGARVFASMSPGPARLALSAAMALAITIPISMASYEFFETPFLRLKKRFEVVESSPV